MIKSFLCAQSRRLSLLSAALFGFGLAVGNLIVGGVCLFAAVVLDFIYCGMSGQN